MPAAGDGKMSCGGIEETASHELLLIMPTVLPTMQELIVFYCFLNNKNNKKKKKNV
jgi:hypothetical protein